MVNCEFVIYPMIVNIYEYEFTYIYCFFELLKLIAHCEDHKFYSCFEMSAHKVALKIRQVCPQIVISKTCVFIWPGVKKD